MKSVAFSLLVAANAAGDTPVTKVVELLQDLRKAAEDGLVAETKTFGEFKTTCGTTQGKLDVAITANKGEISTQSGTIEKLTAQIQKASVTHDEKSTLKAYEERNLEAATTVRQKENEDYIATDRDYQESVTALTNAIKLLNARSSKVSGMSLVQLKAQTTNKVVLGAISQIQNRGADDEKDNYAREEGAMGSLITLLESLKTEFSDRLSELTKAEKEAAHQGKQFMKSTQTAIGGLAKELEALETKMGKKGARKAEAEKALAAAEEQLDANEKELAAFTANCDVNIANYEKQGQLRNDEINAINQAIQIINDGVVANAATHLPALAQKAMSLLQVSTRSKYAGFGENAEVQRQVAAMLQREATQFGSEILAMVATKVTANPLKKVTEMIRDMISNLVREATAEAEAHGSCQSRLVENKEEREFKAEMKAELDAEKEKLDSAINLLGEHITTLDDQINDISLSRATANKERNAEKAENEKTIKDSQDSQVALAQAITVLTNFYKGEMTHGGTRIGGAENAGKATEIEQAGRNTDRPTAAVYSGEQDRSNSILSILDIINRDFQRLENETTANEANSAEAFETFMNESEIESEVMKTQMEHASAQRGEKETDLGANKKELTSTTEELRLANELFANLKAECIDTGMTYEQRKEKRKQEIQSLENAVKVLGCANDRLDGEEPASDCPAAPPAEEASPSTSTTTTTSS